MLQDQQVGETAPQKHSEPPPRGRGEQPLLSRLGEVQGQNTRTLPGPRRPNRQQGDASRPVTAVDLSQGCLLGQHPVGTSKGTALNFSLLVHRGTETRSQTPTTVTLRSELEVCRMVKEKSLHALFSFL